MEEASLALVRGNLPRAGLGYGASVVDNYIVDCIGGYCGQLRLPTVRAHRGRPSYPLQGAGQGQASG
ncbi:hypothetical protein WJX84_004384 [Apatococcus fuscideae]|uniref:Uncharacterized protein n=1 Tax=Apatococcus fuscideae TaxID=2026836 RepID=A0AAW1TGT7_9CHLO